MEEGGGGRGRGGGCPGKPRKVENMDFAPEINVNWPGSLLFGTRPIYTDFNWAN